jgi:DNA-binding IclR family transcriptional regulator
LAAPLAPIHVAWADEAAERRWLATAARKTDHAVDPEIARSELAAVRAQGYAVSTGREAAAEFERNVEGTGGTGDPDLSGVLPELIAKAQGGAVGLAGARDVTSLHAPVFGSDGHAELSLTVNGFTGEESAARLQSCLDRLLAAAARITERIGGTPPS